MSDFKENDSGCFPLLFAGWVCLIVLKIIGATEVSWWLVLIPIELFVAIVIIGLTVSLCCLYNKKKKLQQIELEKRFQDIIKGSENIKPKKPKKQHKTRKNQ